MRESIILCISNLYKYDDGNKDLESLICDYLEEQTGELIDFDFINIGGGLVKVFY